MAVLNLHLFYFSIKKIKRKEKIKTKGTKRFTKIPVQTSIYMSYLYHHGQVNISEIVKMYPHHTPRSICRHCKQKVSHTNTTRWKKRNHQDLTFGENVMKDFL